MWREVGNQFPDRFAMAMLVFGKGITKNTPHRPHCPRATPVDKCQHPGHGRRQWPAPIEKSQRHPPCSGRLQQKRRVACLVGWLVGWLVGCVKSVQHLHPPLLIQHVRAFWPNAFRALEQSQHTEKKKRTDSTWSNVKFYMVAEHSQQG